MLDSLKRGTEFKYLEGKAYMIGIFSHFLIFTFLGATLWIILHENWVDLVHSSEKKLDSDHTKYNSINLEATTSTPVKRENTTPIDEDATPHKIRPF